MADSKNAKSRQDNRTTSRERALHFLYEAESRKISISEVLAAQVLEVDGLAVQLATGVGQTQEVIDELISQYSHAWTLNRMPAIDRNVLRLAIYEIIDRKDVPVAVIINEAVELAKRFSTEESGRFVNGVLSAVAKTQRTKGS